MRPLTPLREARQHYENALAADDRTAVAGLVERLLDDGVAPPDVLTGVVAPVQRAIGERWQRGEWTVAQEHAATAMAMAATDVVARRLNQLPVTAGHVIVTCAEREWHWLPAAIIACVLRADGWRTTQLGPATPPMRLSRYIQDLGPDAVAVSCSVLGALPTTRRFIEAATAAGVPVLVGGAALAPTNSGRPHWELPRGRPTPGQPGTPSPPWPPWCRRRRRCPPRPRANNAPSTSISHGCSTASGGSGR